MNEPGTSLQTCTIVVDLNVAADVNRSISAATTLAEALGAAVQGLFIQEDSLLDLAGLPFSRALSVGGTRGVELSPASMLKAFKRHAEKSRQLLSQQAAKARVEWSFRAERGDLQQKIRDALSQGDFLVLGIDGNRIWSRQLIRQLRSSPPDARGVVVAQSTHDYARSGPVVAIDDGDEPGRDTVALAARIAKVQGVPLHLFAIATNHSEIEKISRRAQALTSHGQALSVFHFLPNTPYTLAVALKRTRPGFVVTDLAGEPFGNDAAALSLCSAAQAPVLLLKHTANHST